MAKLLPINTISFTDSQVLARAGFNSIYVIGYQGDPSGSPLKVGTARDVHSRLHSIQVGNWRQLTLHELFFIRPGPDDGERTAAALESQIHAELTRQSLAVAGEWFSGGSDLIIGTVKRVVAENYDGAVDTCVSMKRRLKMWKIEVEETDASSPFANSNLSIVRAISDRTYSRLKRYGATRAPH